MYHVWQNSDIMVDTVMFTGLIKELRHRTEGPL